MPRPRDDDEIANRILLSLPQVTLMRLLPKLELVPMLRRQVVDHPGGPVTHLYFINRGLVSLVKTMADGRTVEIGAVGIEGATDANAVFGVIDNAIMEAVVQIPGTAFRVGRDVLRHEMDSDDALRTMMQRYMHFFVNQIVQSAACNRLHSLEQRCCRWLLIARDNALCETFPLTHEFLAMMLGVQRSGVSIVAKDLQRARLIQYHRGQVTILNRSGLEAATCECYAAIQALLGRLFDTHRSGAASVSGQSERRSL